MDEYFKLWLYKYFWWKFIIVMKIHQMLKNQHCNENSSLWWKFIIVIKIHYLWWTFVIVMKIYHCDENSSLWWNSSLGCKFILGMPVHQYKRFIIVMKMNLFIHCDEIFILMKICNCNEISLNQSCHENSSIY